VKLRECVGVTAKTSKCPRPNFWRCNIADKGKKPMFPQPKTWTKIRTGTLDVIEGGDTARTVGNVFPRRLAGWTASPQQQEAEKEITGEVARW
jgi:hypothetical protein